MNGEPNWLIMRNQWELIFSAQVFILFQSKNDKGLREPRDTPPVGEEDFCDPL